MHLSLNEISAALRKAGRGAGLPVGLADEVADAAIWLVERGRDGVAAAVQGLASPHCEIEIVQTAPLTLRGPVVVAGPSAVDLLMTEPADGRVRIEAVDAPLLLAGMVGRALEGERAEGERVAVLRFGAGDGLGDGGGEIIVSGGGVQVRAECSSPDLAAPDLPNPGQPVEIRFAASVSGSGRPITTLGAITVDDALWAEVQALAAKTYVPADAASRSRGAGAGAIDNE